MKDALLAVGVTVVMVTKSLSSSDSVANMLEDADVVCVRGEGVTAIV